MFIVNLRSLRLDEGGIQAGIFEDGATPSATSCGREVRTGDARNDCCRRGCSADSNVSSLGGSQSVGGENSSDGVGATTEQKATCVIVFSPSNRNLKIGESGLSLKIGFDQVGTGSKTSWSSA